MIVRCLLGPPSASHELRQTLQLTMQIPSSRSKHLASIDMGTNSFKLLLVKADPSGRFTTVDRIKEPVLLGRGMSSNAEPPSITHDAQLRAISALQNFAGILDHRSVDWFSVVATSAVREAENKLEFLSKVQRDLGLQVKVLSGEDEARLIYRGVLQFLPVYNESILTVDIGGGSTEFALGKEGQLIFATSLKLGHVTLTDDFVKTGELVNMRKKIRSMIEESGLVEKVKAIGFDVAVGSSGTIRSIAKTVFATNSVSSMDFGGARRFTKEELAFIMEKLCGGEVLTLPRVSKRRSEFLLAGAILLWEIFEVLGITKMEVSEYALGEGIIAEMLEKECQSFDVNANVKWRSVVRLATRFNSDNRMRLAVRCIAIAKDIFEALRKYGEATNAQRESAICWDDKDLEYLEAAILLHNIGFFIGKKGYHKQSFHIIKNGGHLDGYNEEEIQIIALLVRYHRKKFPKRDLPALQGFKEEEKQKFRVLCVIIRLSIVLKQFQGMMLRRQEKTCPNDGFELSLGAFTRFLLSPPNLEIFSWEDTVIINSFPGNMKKRSSRTSCRAVLMIISLTLVLLGLLEVKIIASVAPNWLQLLNTMTYISPCTPAFILEHSDKFLPWQHEEEVLTESKDHSIIPELNLADIQMELKPELEHFREIFQENISVVLPSA